MQLLPLTNQITSSHEFGDIDLIFNPEYGDDTLLRNAVNHVQDYVTSLLRG